MPLQEDQKSSTPFKCVDIKTLLFAAGSRKRKASSPIPTTDEVKNAKVSDKEGVETVQTGDSKENKDLNADKAEINVDKLSSETDKKALQTGSDCSVSNEEDSLSSSECLDSSLLNSSIDALNGNGVSETFQCTTETANLLPGVETDKTESKSLKISGKEHCNTNTKKRKRMTPTEAKQKSEERAKKQQERFLKKQEFQAKKLEREQELKRRKLQKEEERKAKEEERKAKEEERKAKEDERKAKEEEKKEKERLRLEKKEQEEKEKQLKLEEKEAQKRIRQMQLEMKLEMKKKKEEMKLKLDEERKKAEEAKKKAELEKEQKEKERKERAKAAFVKFFVKENVSPPPLVQKTIVHDSVFKPFQISEDMKLAPVVPPIARKRFDREKLDIDLKSQSDTELYLQILKSKTYCDVRNRKKQRKPKLCDTDVIIIDESNQSELTLTAKLFQFSENVRPPYWGTWRKKSKHIRPRRPFSQDAVFDYSVDSDEEWDEGGPGESLSGTEPEDESEDDYEVDNEFFVPHGYLSAEEENQDDEDGKDNELSDDPEKQKALLKKKLQEFEMERKRKTTELKPIILGCLIENDPKSQAAELRALLEPYTAVFVTNHPIPTFSTVKKSPTESGTNSAASSPTFSVKSAAKFKKAVVPEEAMAHLIRLIHGNSHSVKFMIKEFLKFWEKHCHSQNQSDKPIPVKAEDSPPENNPNVVNDTIASDVISKRQLNLTVKQIATKRFAEAAKRFVWIVNEDVLEKYGLRNAPIPNEWTYVTAIKKEEIQVSPEKQQPVASIKDYLAQ